MGVIAVAVRHLIAAGVSGEALVAAIADLEAENPVEKKAELRRAKDRERKRSANSTDSVESVDSLESEETSLPPTDGFPDLSLLTSNPSKENPPKGGQKKVSQERGTRLPQDWDLPTEWGDWALEQGLSREKIILECDKFKDHFIARAGPHGVKRNWQATWRNWIRRNLEGFAA